MQCRVHIKLKACCKGTLCFTVHNVNIKSKSVQNKNGDCLEKYVNFDQDFGDFPHVEITLFINV